MKLSLPKVVFGSSALGNIFEVVPDETKLRIAENWIRHQSGPVIDSAGKYGAGLSLESIGQCLKELKVDPNDVLISNKLGWKRVLLTGDEPTFEKGVWFGLEHDAEQYISYEGILECYQQGNKLLGDYKAHLLSVHDPDEYVAAANSEADAAKRYQDILEAYRALAELRASGEAKGIGVGSKDWKIVKRLYDDGIQFDWVMLANTFTIYNHPDEVIAFMEELNQAEVAIINSAVFNAGFLIGGKFFDYQVISRESHSEIFDWRDRFNEQCKLHGISPVLACCQFALSPPGVTALSLNTSKPERVKDNVALVNDQVPSSFWDALKETNLLNPNYPFL